MSGWSTPKRALRSGMGLLLIAGPRSVAVPVGWRGRGAALREVEGHDVHADGLELEQLLCRGARVRHEGVDRMRRGDRRHRGRSDLRAVGDDGQTPAVL